jgi:hypothetical protein
MKNYCVQFSVLAQRFSAGIKYIFKRKVCLIDIQATAFKHQ